jgi:hypothetical protein
MRKLIGPFLLGGKHAMTRISKAVRIGGPKETLAGPKPGDVVTSEPEKYREPMSTTAAVITPHSNQLSSSERYVSSGRTSAPERSTWSANELILYAKENPPEAIIDGLLHVGDTLLIHGVEESFKSVFAVQIGESIALGRAFLRCWKCRKSRRTGIIETEMHPAMLGERLSKMFPSGNAPPNLLFFGDSLLKEWRGQDMKGKFQIIERWITDQKIEVLVIDTANDFFRGT